jgi:hydrogenase-1 operon protein HyaF
LVRDYDFLADDGLIDALLAEIAALLQILIADGVPGSIDLRGLPLSDACLAALEQRLGKGEITAVLDAAGRSEFHETRFPGVWWSRHADETGRLAALLIEVAVVPEILRAGQEDMRRGHQGLLDAAYSRQDRKSA